MQATAPSVGPSGQGEIGTLTGAAPWYRHNREMLQSILTLGSLPPNHFLSRSFI